MLAPDPRGETCGGRVGLNECGRQGRGLEVKSVRYPILATNGLSYGGLTAEGAEFPC